MLFPKSEWTKATARNWLKARAKYKYDDIVLEGNHYRARQVAPDLCVPGSYSTIIWRSRHDAAMRGRRKPKKILVVMCDRKARR